MLAIIAIISIIIILMVIAQESADARAYSIALQQHIELTKQQLNIQADIAQLREDINQLQQLQ